MRNIVFSNFKSKLQDAYVSSTFFEKIGKRIDRLCRPVLKLFLSIARHFYKIENDKIIFSSLSMGPYQCNPKYIYEELIRQKRPYRYTWVVNAADLNFMKTFINDSNSKVVAAYTYEAFKEMASAKIWVENSMADIFPKRRKNQFFIQTWHGSMGIKTMNSVLPRKVYNQVTTIISNSFFENYFFRQFWTNASVMMYGHARNDLFFHKELIEKARHKVNRYFNISDNLKIVIYAPTYRTFNNNIIDNLDIFHINSKRLKTTLEKHFGGKWEMMLRLHYYFHYTHLIQHNQVIDCEKIFNASSYPDMQELLARADLVISDYSSLMYDLLLLDTPGIIYAPDYKNYNKNKQALHYPLESTPFPLAETENELIAAIENYDVNSFRNKKELFLKNKGCIEDGHAAKRIAAKIGEIIENKPMKVFMNQNIKQDYSEWAENTGWK
jgi:CDP-glycerol glycerophosphotransferase